MISLKPVILRFLFRCLLFWLLLTAPMAILAVGRSPGKSWWYTVKEAAAWWWKKFKLGGL